MRSGREGRFHRKGIVHLQLLSNVSIWIGIAFCITQSAIFLGHHEQVQDRVAT
jgi:hypothetical protein